MFKASSIWPLCGVHAMALADLVRILAKHEVEFIETAGSLSWWPTATGLLTMGFQLRRARAEA